MSKITVNAALAVLRLVLVLVAKSIRLIYSVMDLVDDGCLNASVPRPDWMFTLSSVLSTFESMSGHLAGIESELSSEAK